MTFSLCFLPEQCVFRTEGCIKNQKDILKVKLNRNQGVIHCVYRIMCQVSVTIVAVVSENNKELRENGNDNVGYK